MGCGCGKSQKVQYASTPESSSNVLLPRPGESENTKLVSVDAVFLPDLSEPGSHGSAEPRAREEEIEAMFLELDVDEDGFVSREDLCTSLCKLGASKGEIDQLFKSTDRGCKGVIDYDDFKRNFKAFTKSSFSSSRRLEGDGSPCSPKSMPSSLVRAPSRGLSSDAIASELEAMNQAVRAGSLGILLVSASSVPTTAWLGSESNPYVIVEVRDKNGNCLARERTFTVQKDMNPTWNQVLSLPVQDEQRSASSDVLPEHWELETTSVRFSMFDADMLFDHFIGECEIPLCELIEHSHMRLLLWDKAGEAVLGSSPPSMPCELSLHVVPGSIPPHWHKSSFLAEAPRPSYPYHVFMMTRGTRGDVQPFVALARGMAEQLGWLVTICTELRWKSFVKSNADVSNGKIRFRPSGGDTEARMATRMAKWALQSKSELMQMAILAASEVEFFSSATVFVSHVLECERESRPVDLVVFGLTVARVAALICELCNRPLVGFILQPSCIPSDDKEWKAVLPLDPGESSFTSHESLKKMKDRMETTRFKKYNLDYLRTSFGLEVEDTWATLRQMEVPLVIPMTEGTFPRPSDWWPGIFLTNFIFLRNSKPGAHSLGEPLGSFILKARSEHAKLCVMTFSSMPVSRKLMLTCAVKMLEDCRFDLRLIYVGKRMSDNVSSSLSDRTRILIDSQKFLEVERADFGLLFKEMDCFIVHGGLGTTVEALRLNKPCCVTGPLLLDQRFWGSVCAQKGVGPESVHIDSFEQSCVQFVDGALDPADPLGWQRKAREHDWGDEADDGIASNVNWFRGFVRFTESRMDPMGDAGRPSSDTETMREETANPDWGLQEQTPLDHTMRSPDDTEGKSKGKGKTWSSWKGRGKGRGEADRPRNDRNPFDCGVVGQNPFDNDAFGQQPSRDLPPDHSSRHVPQGSDQLLDVGRLVAHSGAHSKPDVLPVETGQLWPSV